MAFVRLVQVVTDYALGLQTVNQQRDNLDALLAAIAAQHSQRETLSSPPPARGFGHHDTPLIPRSVVPIATTLTPAGTGRTFSTTAGLTTDAVGAVVWVTTGLCFLPIYGFSRFWAVCTPRASAATDIRFVRAVAWYPVGSQAGLFFVLREWDGAAWDLADFDFCAAIHGDD